MKKLVMTMLVVVVLLVVPATGKTEDNLYRMYLSAGGGKESMSVEYGGTTLHSKGRNKLLGFGASFFNDADRTLEFGEEQNISAFSGKLGLEVIKDSGVFINVIGGIVFRNKCVQEGELIDDKTHPDGKYWQTIEETEGKTDILFGTGITYFVSKNSTPIVISVDYDNYRKLTGSVGFVWRF